MRDSLLSLALFWLGGLAWAGALVGPRLAAGPADSSAQTMLFAGLALFGQWTILSSHLAYARHVLLDAHGLIAPPAESRRRLTRRKPKSAELQPASEPATSERRAAVATGGKAPAAAASKPAAAPVAVAKPAASPQPATGARLGVVDQKSDDQDDDEDSLQNLSLRRAQALRSASSAVNSAMPPSPSGQPPRGCPPPRASTMICLGHPGHNRRGPPRGPGERLR